MSGTARLAASGGKGRRRRLGVVVLVVAALLIAGCGSDTASPAPDASDADGTATCSWPQGGYDMERSYRTDCPSRIDASTAAQLAHEWFFGAADVVSASPVVVDDTVYLGDWSGRFYAIDVATGQERWHFDAEVNEGVYAGQITASAAHGVVGGVPTVYFPSGKTVHALEAATGRERWRVDVGSGPGAEPTEIEGAPLLVEDLLIVGVDVHNSPDHRAGVFAFDAATGAQRWRWDGDAGGDPSGCVDVWGTLSADVERRTVYFGTGNCPSAPSVWLPATEAVVAVDLDSGEQRWAFQPHGPNNDDLDFAAAPNLFAATGRDLVGMGNKDGTYYALDRDTGELVWSAEATGPGLEVPGRNFSTGGFIAASAVVEGTIVGGTGVGPPPYLHGIDATTGDILWQQARAEATYAPPAAVNDVVFIGGNDFTLRAVRASDGEIVWSHPVEAPISGGPAIVGDDLFAVVGLKEPGTAAPVQNAGVHRFRLPAPGEATTSTTAPTTATTAPGVTGVDLANRDQPCIDADCPIPFTLKPVPSGLEPSGTLRIETAPFRLVVEVTGLGEPTAWLTEGSQAADDGAGVFAVYLSEADDNPVGGLICVIEAGRCEGDALPRRATYNRLTILAVNDPSTLPPPAEGLARMVTTLAFNPPLTPAEP